MKNSFKSDFQKNEDLPKFFNEADSWLLIRLCKDGLHLHCKKENDIELIGLVCIQNQEIWNMVKTFVHDHK